MERMACPIGSLRRTVSGAIVFFQAASSQKERNMSFKFGVGQAVDYKPPGERAGHFMVVRQMPEEPPAVERNYHIKSDQEGFQRSVLEHDLRASS